MKAEIKATNRIVKTVDRLGNPGTRLQPCVQIITEGIPFCHDCASPEEAQRIALLICMKWGV